MAKTLSASDYEMSRELRIKENRERMQKLGIVDLFLQIKSFRPSPKRNYNRKTKRGYSPSPHSGPLRRSSRLQNSTPVGNCEVHETKEWFLIDNNSLREEGSKPEAYAKERENLGGSTEMEWSLSADGDVKRGKRIYDLINGKSCHQCRQKTLGHRTRCSKCTQIRGQFCGSCLYTRYGENIFEANVNPDWICPVCRGICNCSLCRKAKGWAPTGNLYKKISSLGFNSVAHYLAQTRPETTHSDENQVVSKIMCSARRSLAFSDADDVMAGDENLWKSNLEIDTETSHPLVTEKKRSNDECGDCKIETESGITHDVTIQLKDEFEQLLEPEMEENTTGCGDIKEDNNKLYDESLKEQKVSSHQVSNESITTKSTHDEKSASKCEVVGDVGDDKVTNSIRFVETLKFTKKKRKIIVEPSPDSIAARLRQRRNDADSIGVRLRLRKRA